MRITQFFGLTNEAKNFLDQNVKRVPCSPYPHCGKATSTKIVMDEYEDASHLGMFNDGPTLKAYALKNGTIIKEVVQATPWSSGPCIFLCLEDEKGNRIDEWPQEEIDKI